MKIYTRKGDDGTTSLLGGTRVAKHDLRIEAYGTVDELNSFLGLLGDQAGIEAFLPLIRRVQDRLFVIGSGLANDPETSRYQPPQLAEEDIAALEASMDEMDAQLPELRNFVLPGGHPANSLAHVCRTVCRRAERRTTELALNQPVDALVIRYLNRLSDWFFVLARYASFRTGTDEIRWNG
jgi:cob(I)alamin adenosyltransferase